jgi:hemerythrin-like metal-binding protein
MKLLKWKDAYSMGEAEIDKQHKGLFNLSNDIYYLVQAGVDNSEQFRELFMSLTDYTIDHFIYEEMYIQEEGFPGLEEHIQQHLEFSNKLKDICIGINKETHIKDIGEFITTWLVNHVIEEDMKYKKFVANK